MHNLGDGYYINLRKAKNQMVFEQYSLVDSKFSQDMFYLHNIILIKEIYTIGIALIPDVNLIEVQVVFIDEKDEIKTFEVCVCHKNFIFSNFTQVANLINLLTTFIYSKPFLTLESNHLINIDEKAFIKLNEMQSGLLSLSHNIEFEGSHKIISSLDNNGELRYYFDIKVFDFADKKMLLLYCSRENKTDFSICFLSNPIILESNSTFNRSYSFYSVEIMDLKYMSNKKTYTIIHGLLKDDYYDLKLWLNNLFN